MSIEAIGGATQVEPYAYSPQQPESRSAPEHNKPAEELTTITTHCDKEHQHTAACPHTVTTQPAPKPKLGANGSLLDKKI